MSDKMKDLIDSYINSDMDESNFISNFPIKERTYVEKAFDNFFYIINELNKEVEEAYSILDININSLKEKVSKMSAQLSSLQKLIEIQNEIDSDGN